MPRVRCEARDSVDVADLDWEEETSVPSPWVVEEPCLAMRRETP